MGRLVLPVLVLAAALVGLLWAAEYGFGPLVITKENQYRVIVGLFGPRAVITEPGWDPKIWKIPFADEEHTYDNRLQYLNAKPVQVLIANNEKLIVDYYAIWRVVDPLLFLENFGGEFGAAESRIQEVVKSLVGSRIGGLQLEQLLRRAEILSQLHKDSSQRLEGTGVEVVDVRLNRTELPPNAVPATYAQMREQRNALAREHRAQGDREAREIRAAADREAVATRAKARSDASRLRGEGDALSTRVYAKAHGKDAEFYAFVRSLEAYRNTIGAGTTLIVSPDHEFFRYFGSLKADPAPRRRPRSRPVGAPPPPRPSLPESVAEPGAEPAG